MTHSMGGERISATSMPGVAHPFLSSVPPDIRVLLVDDHPGFRAALSSALAVVEGMQVAGEASDGETAVVTAVAIRPDLVIMDLSMPGISGIEATRKLHQRLPGTPVVILTAHAAPAIERDAMAAGAAGFLAKGAPFEELLTVMREARAAHDQRRASTA